MQKCKRAISLLFFPCSDHFLKQRYLDNGSSTHHQLITKLTVQSVTTTQRPHSYKFILVDKSCSQLGLAAVYCIGRHFLMLYACAHVVSFPNQRPQSLIWELDQCTCEIASCLFPVVVAKGYAIIKAHIQLLTYSYGKKQPALVMLGWSCLSMVVSCHEKENQLHKRRYGEWLVLHQVLASKLNHVKHLLTLGAHA